MTGLTVHPLADIFPMMSEEELAALAADIKANGLLHAIAIDEDGTLIDGRNRLRACEIAGVEPQFEKINGHDASALIVSANLARRNLSKGQQAMALAMIYPEPEKGGRGKNAGPRKAAETAGFSGRRLAEARSVLRHSRALAEDVIQNRKSLDAALKQIAEEQEASASADMQMIEIRRAAPDLAELVDEERLALAEAYSTMKRRIADAEAAEANKREVMIRISESAWQATTAWASDEFVTAITERLADEEFRRSWRDRLRADPKRLKDVQRGAAALSKVLARFIGEEQSV